MYCESCEYFGEEIIDTDWGASPTTKGTGFHTCTIIEHVMSDELRNCKDNAGVVDGSDYQAALIVKERFGCVNFKERKEKGETK